MLLHSISCPDIKKFHESATAVGTSAENTFEETKIKDLTEKLTGILDRYFLFHIFKELKGIYLFYFEYLDLKKEPLFLRLTSRFLAFV